MIKFKIILQFSNSAKLFDYEDFLVMMIFTESEKRTIFFAKIITKEMNN